MTTVDLVVYAMIPMAAFAALVIWHLSWESVFIQGPFLYQRNRITGWRRATPLRQPLDGEKADCLWLNKATWRGNR